MISRDNRHLWVLGGVLAVGLAAALVVRALLVPATFGDLGPFRAANIAEQADHKVKLAAVTECLECHQAVGDVKAEGPHAALNCFDCHGVAREHIERCVASAEAVKAGRPATCEGKEAITADMHVEKSAAECLVCHLQMTGRPAEHKQVTAVKHARKKGAEHPEGPESCFECHMAHDPNQTPPEPDADPGVTATDGEAR